MPTEEELTSGNIEAFKPEPQEDDNEGPTVEEVEANTDEEPETENEEEGGEARSKNNKSGGSSSKKPQNKGKHTF